MEGAPALRNSTSFAPPTITAPAISLSSARLRFLNQGEQTKIFPPALTKQTIKSFSGAKPGS